LPGTVIYEPFRFLEHLLVARKGPYAIYLPVMLHVMVPHTLGEDQFASAKALGMEAIYVIQEEFTAILRECSPAHASGTSHTYFAPRDTVCLALQFQPQDSYNLVAFGKPPPTPNSISGHFAAPQMAVHRSTNQTQESPGQSSMEGQEQGTNKGLRHIEEGMTVNAVASNEQHDGSVRADEPRSTEVISIDDSASGAQPQGRGPSYQTDITFSPFSRNSERLHSLDPPMDSRLLRLTGDMPVNPNGVGEMRLVGEVLHVRAYPPNTSLLHLSEGGWVIKSKSYD